MITIAIQNSLKSGSYDASSFFFLKIALVIMVPIRCVLDLVLVSSFPPLGNLFLVVCNFHNILNVTRSIEMFPFYFFILVFFPSLLLNLPRSLSVFSRNFSLY